MHSKRLLTKYKQRTISTKTALKISKRKNIESIYWKQLMSIKTEYNLEKQYVLSPISLKDLENIFDDKAIKALQYFLAKAWYNQPELKPGQNEIPFQVTKEHIEQWMVQALGVEPSGAGSYPVDIISTDLWGADIKSLKCKTLKDGSFSRALSGETSLAQKFKVETDLDELFKRSAYEEIIRTYGEIVKNKLNQAIREKHIKQVFYFFLLNKNDEFYLCGFRVNIKGLDRIIPLDNTKTSVTADKFIDPELGEMKVYKSKKRFELRLRPRGWSERRLLMKINLPFAPQRSTVEVRDIIDRKQAMSDHIEAMFSHSHSSFLETTD
jgi:hypothetical protein